MDSDVPLCSFPRHLAEQSSLSRTPSRRQQFTEHEITPLLSNLSPNATLEALAATDAVPTGKSHRRSFIYDSVASASTSERAWGIKAALTGKKLREWHGELSAWAWKGYDPRALEEEGHQGLRMAEEYAERIEVIKDDMETLEVEDLKTYVRNTRRSSASTAPTDYEYLGDFTAIVTATIVQALPVLARLTSLLSIWSTRLMIVRQVPRLLRDLADGQESVLSAQMAVRQSKTSLERGKSGFSRQSFLEIQAVLRDQVSHLGQSLDHMLDLLEGSQDTLPEQWIDAMDDLEREYGSWVVEAEEMALRNEMNDGNYDDQGIEQEVESAGYIPAFPALKHPFRTPESIASSPSIQRRDLMSDGVGMGPSSRLSSHENGPDRAHNKDVETAVVTSRTSPSDSIALNDSQPVNLAHTAQDKLGLNRTKTSSDPDKPIHRPPPLVLTSRIPSPESTEPSDMGSGTSDAGSAISDYFSDKSSPEIRSASLVEFVSTPALVTNPWSSREAMLPLENPAQHPSHRAHGPFALSQNESFISPQSQRSRASTYIPETTFNLGSGLVGSISNANPHSRHHARTRSASMQSIEVVPKSEIRRIMVRRSESYNSAPFAPQAPVAKAKIELNAVPTSIGPQEHISEPPDETSFVSHETRKEQAPPRSVDHSDRVLQAFGRPSQSQGEPSIPPKSPRRFQQASHVGSGSTLGDIRRKIAGLGNSHQPVAPGIASVKKVPMNTDDQLEARISSILREVPTQIRLTSGPEPDAPEVDRSINASRTPVARTPAMRLARAQTSLTPPTLTLTPAQPKSTKSQPQASEPEIKLYHLHQPGKELPIKLHVRLVGEAGERVMVRIGGGWADLAEYLKEYASHHGRRSVSDTRIDIHGISSTPLTHSSPLTRPGTPISSRPNPAMVFKRQQTTPGKFESPQTPASDPSVRSISGTSWPDEDSPSLGLAGPKAKNVDISPSKQAWVDDMLGQAKAGYGGSGIGEMGKMGGTKRVWLKGGSKAGTNV